MEYEGSYYRIHNSLSVIPNPSQLKQVHTFTPYLRKIHFNIILVWMPFLHVCPCASFNWAPRHEGVLGE
jgi:hypothetical protein